VSGWVIDYDHEEYDPATNKRYLKHYVLRPCGGENEAETTKRNLKLNKRIRNVVLREDTNE